MGYTDHSFFTEVRSERKARRKYHDDSLESYCGLMHHATQHGDESLSLELTKEDVYTKLLASMDDAQGCVL